MRNRPRRQTILASCGGRLRGLFVFLGSGPASGFFGRTFDELGLLGTDHVVEFFDVDGLFPCREVIRHTIHDQLSQVLGNMETFGAKKKMTAKKLAKYHYMMTMQRFDDPSELGSFESHEAALAAVEKGLAVEGDALTQIYRIDIPGKDQSVFGVGMKATNDEEEDIDSTFQMSIVDFEGYSKVAYFPYEVLVSGKEVEALHMRFRMAVHFPDLSMMGEHGFTKLMSAPGATEDALENMVSAE